MVISGESTTNHGGTPLNTSSWIWTQPYLGHLVWRSFTKSATTSQQASQPAGFPTVHQLSLDYVLRSFLFSHAARFRGLEATVTVPLLGLGGYKHNMMGKLWTFIQTQCHVGVHDYCSQRKEGRKEAGNLRGALVLQLALAIGKGTTRNGAIMIITLEWLEKF